MTLNVVWGQAHPKTYTRAQNSESLMSATLDVVKNVKGKWENDSVEVCSRKLIAVPLYKCLSTYVMLQTFLKNYVALT